MRTPSWPTCGLRARLPHASPICGSHPCRPASCRPRSCTGTRLRIPHDPQLVYRIGVRTGVPVHKGWGWRTETLASVHERPRLRPMHISNLCHVVDVRPQELLGPCTPGFFVAHALGALRGHGVCGTNCVITRLLRLRRRVLLLLLLLQSKSGHTSGHKSRQLFTCTHPLPVLATCNDEHMGSHQRSEATQASIGWPLCCPPHMCDAPHLCMNRCRRRLGVLSWWLWVVQVAVLGPPPLAATGAEVHLTQGVMHHVMRLPLVSCGPSVSG